MIDEDESLNRCVIEPAEPRVVIEGDLPRPQNWPIVGLWCFSLARGRV